MILSEVTYESNAGYELRYICHSCEKTIPNNRFEFCPFCGVKLNKTGRPEKLELNEGDICGLIAITITNGGFEEKGLSYMSDGKNYKIEGPGCFGEVWASWKKTTLENKRKERESLEQTNGGAE